MFCTQCGKEIENGTICEECAEKLSLMKETTSLNEENGETPVVFVEQPTIQAPVGNRKAGLTKAIVGAVIGFIALMIVSIGSGLLSGALELAALGEISVQDYDIIFGLSMVVSVVGLLACIPTIILGIASIKTFLREKRETNTKPLATLIVGIVSLTWVASCVLTFFITLLTAGLAI